MSKSNKTSSSKSKKSTSSKKKNFDIMTDTEHVLKRSDTYVGSVKPIESDQWIYDENAKEGDPKIIKKRIDDYIPAFYKIYDEVIVNAADHTTRDGLDEVCDTIKINIDKDSGEITVWNNGDGIPIEENEKTGFMIPYMVFGVLRTSENYDDDEERTTGGKNGFGAKLTNLFSTKFEVETCDGNQIYYQKYENNMSKVHKPKIKDSKGKKQYTQISYIPDYERFGMKGLTDDIIGLFKRRAYDLGFTCNMGEKKVKVYLNGTKLSTKFEDYVDMYFPENGNFKKVIDGSQEGWKVCVVYDETEKQEHDNISFVNNICTQNGGTHVDHVSNKVMSHIKEYVEKKHKKKVTNSIIKENLVFFVSSKIVNPIFESQSKEQLKTPERSFKWKFEPAKTFYDKIVKTGIVSRIVDVLNAKENASLSKTDGKKTSRLKIPKLYNATKAGTKESAKCCLFLTEGDSAQTFAVSGLNELNRDYYGVFPLRGKLLNVRDTEPTKISENEEITNLKKIIGLVQGKEYKSLSELRYGHIIILTDQDVDGSHIKGLLINFIHYFWPSLAKYEGFIQCLSTPIVKISKGKNTLSFYSMNEFEEWKKENNDGKGWGAPKYYKGLGTHKPKEAREAFEEIDEKLISYYWPEPKNKKSSEEKKSPVDPCDDSIRLAFDKTRADDRKKWINTFDRNVYIDNSQKKISYCDFINKELIAFSVYDVERSIPNIMDGFKPSLRKIYYGSVKKKIYGPSKEIKVAQLGGYISEHTAYHHGEKSLFEAIIGMAQNFVGSNNINLLYPNGQFGSRLAGGKDAASERYIFTYLTELNKKIFNNDDFDILEKQYDDGNLIEPRYFAPIIPMILVNGSSGIGTGYSTDIPPYNPKDIINNLRRFLNGKKMKRMIPWYRNFNGTVVSNEDDSTSDSNKKSPKKAGYITKGRYEIDGDILYITDLPIGVWTTPYKTFLENLEDTAKESKTTKSQTGGSKTQKKTVVKKGAKGTATSKVARDNKIGLDIKSVKEECTDVKISFTITFQDGTLSKWVKSGKLEKLLKLQTPVSISNMHLFDADGKIKKYDTELEIIKDYAVKRLDMYEDRKNHILGELDKEIDILSEKMRFIKDVVEEKIIIYKKKRDVIIEVLKKRKYKEVRMNDETKESYNYLLKIPIVNFTQEEIDKLQGMIDDRKAEYATLKEKSPAEIWSEELDYLEEEYNEWDRIQTEEYEQSLLEKKKKKNKRKKKE